MQKKLTKIHIIPLHVCISVKREGEGKGGKVGDCLLCVINSFQLKYHACRLGTFKQTSKNLVDDRIYHI